MLSQTVCPALCRGGQTEQESRRLPQEDHGKCGPWARCGQEGLSEQGTSGLSPSDSWTGQRPARRTVAVAFSQPLAAAPARAPRVPLSTPGSMYRGHSRGSCVGLVCSVKGACRRLDRTSLLTNRQAPCQGPGVTVRDRHGSTALPSCPTPSFLEGQQSLWPRACPSWCSGQDPLPTGPAREAPLHPGPGAGLGLTWCRGGNPEASPARPPAAARSQTSLSSRGHAGSWPGSRPATG